MAENEKQEPEVKVEDTETPKILGPMDSGFALLKRFRESAPGSHKHAQSVVSMVENVCAAVDLDPEALKVAAMYHDIGKIWCPKLFTENQGDENIHDGLDPWVSFQLISRHVSDTVAILFENDFPKDVIRIASQHHGNCVMQAMYEKAREKDPNVSQEDFRYFTSKPDCVESLILMLCDQIEATSRSIYREQGRDVDPAVFVINIYNKLHIDGQFDDVSVFLGKLKKIQRALISDVASNFQKRVAYGEDDELVKKE